MTYIYYPRNWWDNTGLPRLGDPVPVAERTEIIVHHTVTVDGDTSPTVWETDAEIQAHMRLLQTIRPDLGADVPYNFVAFCRPDGSLTICEGRGPYRAGAHTKYHNRTGLATSFAANFEANPLPFDFIPSLNQWFGFQKRSTGFNCTNLANFYGHRDFAGTACPGSNLYATKLRWAFGQFEEEDMTLTAEEHQWLEEAKTASRNVDVETDPMIQQWPQLVADVAAIKAALGAAGGGSALTTTQVRQIVREELNKTKMTG